MITLESLILVESFFDKLTVCDLFSEIGNDDELKGIEIVGDDVDFYKIISTQDYEECKNECKKRFFCRSW